MPAPTPIITLLCHPVTVTTASTECLAAKAVGNRTSITFHNPGSITVFVCPETDATGAALPAVVSGAGMLEIIGGGSQTVNNPSGSGWNCIAASSAVLTVLEFVSP